MPALIGLRQPGLHDQKEFLAAVLRSRGLHRPWIYAPSSAAKFREYVGRHDARTHWNFLVIRRDTGEMVGVINVSNAVRGSFHSAYLGYYAFAGHHGQGLMREAMHAVLRHAFRRLKLHRLEANIQPGNAASIALVRSCGFRKEGFSPKYLKVGGRWRDHERWAVVAPRA